MFVKSRIFLCLCYQKLRSFFFILSVGVAKCPWSILSHHKHFNHLGIHCFWRLGDRAAYYLFWIPDKPLWGKNKSISVTQHNTSKCPAQYIRIWIVGSKMKKMALFTLTFSYLWIEDKRYNNLFLFLRVYLNVSKSVDLKKYSLDKETIYFYRNTEFCGLRYFLDFL